MPPPLPVIAPAIATPMVAAAADVPPGLVSVLGQLGVGGALVWFASRLWRTFENRRDELDAQQRVDIAGLQERHATALEDLKNEAAAARAEQERRHNAQIEQLRAEHSADVAMLREDIAHRDAELRDTRQQLIEALKASQPPRPARSTDNTPDESE